MGGGQTKAGDLTNQLELEHRVLAELVPGSVALMFSGPWRALWAQDRPAPLVENSIYHQFLQTQPERWLVRRKDTAEGDRQRPEPGEGKRGP